MNGKKFYLSYRNEKRFAAGRGIDPGIKGIQGHGVRKIPGPNKKNPPPGK